MYIYIYNYIYIVCCCIVRKYCNVIINVRHLEHPEWFWHDIINLVAFLYTLPFYCYSELEPCDEPFMESALLCFTA